MEGVCGSGREGIDGLSLRMRTLVCVCVCARTHDRWLV